MPNRACFRRFADEVRSGIERFLSQAFLSYPDSEVRSAAEYVALDAGHRWRAMVAVAAGCVFHEDAIQITLPGACGVELAHTASLVLDDLPSMDDAELRRGKACVHLQFPSWAADLLPVFLVNMAYRSMLDNPLAPNERRIKAALVLAETAAEMIDGQETDLTLAQHDGSGDPEERLLCCYRRKSGMLFSAAAKVGAILCGATESEAESLASSGLCLGMYYQLQDDVADVEGGVDELGKQPGMDRHKLTAPDLFGVGGAKRRATEYFEKALTLLEQYGSDASVFRHLLGQVTLVRT